MELREALGQIAQIRQQMARGEIFRGYRAATTAFSGFIALLAGLVQVFLIPDPKSRPGAFVVLWVGAATISLLVVAAEMILRIRRSHSQVQRQLSLLAVEQFVPTLVAGGLLTYVFCDALPEAVPLLPGLWMMLFSLGVFASSRLLPRAVFAVAGFYLVAGLVALLAADRGFAFSPWLMAGAFGAGQLAIAAILYFRLERAHG